MLSKFYFHLLLYHTYSAHCSCRIKLLFWFLASSYLQVTCVNPICYNSSLVCYGLQVKLWDVDNSALIHTFYESTSVINQVAFHPDGTCVAAACADGTTKVIISYRFTHCLHVSVLGIVLISSTIY